MKPKRMILDFIKNQIDFIIGALYGTGVVVAQVATPTLSLLEIALNTAVVTVVAYVVKEFVKWIHGGFFNKKR